MAIVQNKYGAAVVGPSAAVTVTLGAAVGSGNAVAIIVQFDALSTGVAPWSDAAHTLKQFDGTNTYTLGYNPTLSKNPLCGLFVYYATNITSAPTTFNIYPQSGTTNLRAWVVEMNGRQTSSPVDATTYTPNPGANSGAPLGTATLAAANEDVLVWMNWADTGTSTTSTPGSGYTAGSNLTASDYVFAEYQNFATSGSKNGDATLAAGESWEVSMVSFLAAAGGAASYPMSSDMYF